MKKKKKRKNKPSAKKVHSKKAAPRNVFSLQLKLILLLGSFLIVTSLVFYAFFRNYLIQDRILNIKEFQLLHTANTTRAFADELLKLKNDFTLNAVKLVDPSKGTVELDKKQWLWVRAGDFTWKSENFRGQIPPPSSNYEKWTLSPRGKNLYLRNKIPLLRDGVKETLLIDGEVKQSVFSAFQNNIEQGAIQGIILSLGDKLRNIQSSTILSHDDSQKNFSRLFKSLSNKRKTNFLKFERPIATEIISEGNRYFVSWAPIPISKSRVNLGFVSFISEQVILGKFKKFIVEIAFYSIFILGIGLICATILAKHISKPIEDLKKATSILQRGDFSARVNVKRRDEIGSLGLAFNKMGQALQERDIALNNAQNALIQSEKMSAIGTMSAGLAHEVKNPLAGILGNAELAVKKTQDLPEEQKTKLQRYLGVIQKETKRCKQIIEGLMRFSRAEKLELQATDLELVSLEVISLLEHSLRKNNVTLSTEFDKNLWQILGSFNHLEQVILNMIQNASQAMPEGGGQIVLKTMYFADPKTTYGKYLAYEHPEFKAPFCRIMIADNGSGMDESYQRKIFEPFVTSKERGKGTGLGLAVTMGILSDHKSRVSITSAPGKGTTFFLDFIAHSERSAEIVEKIRNLRTGEVAPAQKVVLETQESLEFQEEEKTVTEIEIDAADVNISQKEEQSPAAMIDSPKGKSDTLAGFSIRKPGKKKT